MLTFCGIYIYIYIFAECADRFYNINCSGICGFCINDEICDKNNGSCPNGCLEHFKDPLCQGISINKVYFIYLDVNLFFDLKKKIGFIIRNWEKS